MKHFMVFWSLISLGVFLGAQTRPLEHIPASVDFSRVLRSWDGFGFNYVETCQTRDYNAWQQDYGGFSYLGKKERKEIIELVFGEDGLQVDIVKMFLDPWHQTEPGGSFDHETTTVNMRSFVEGGLKLTRKRGSDLEIITTLYGPPSWATMQKHIGGRDLDPSMREDLGHYMADWLAYLARQDYPVKYLSLHNEGEDFYRWDFEEGRQRLERFDYNMYWRPGDVNDFLKIMPGILEEYKLEDVKLSNGEPSNWTRFYYWGYADALCQDSQALENLGLITTHGFLNGDMGRLSFGTANSLTNSLLRTRKPELRSWVTSFAWKEMGIDFVRMVHENIYSAEVNAIIPWAGIQVPEEWLEGDALGTAILVSKDGSYELTRGYYYYKQLCRAGKRGMGVAHALAANPQVYIIAFSGLESGHPDAFVLTSNIRIWSLPVRVEVRGSGYERFRAFRTSENGSETYKEIGIFEVEDGAIIYDPPAGSTTTFIGME